MQTFNEMLNEALNGNIDLSVGYSLLKDIYKRQNFTVESAKLIGNSKVNFIYKDPESKAPEKLRTLTVQFEVNKISEKEKNDLAKKVIKEPQLSFSMNKYYQFLKLVTDKMYKKPSGDVKGGIALYDEKKTVGKESFYSYVSYIYNSNNGDFVDAYTINIHAKK